MFFHKYLQVLTKEDQITNLKAGRVKVSLRLLRAAMSEYQYVCHVDGHDADQDYYIRTVYYYGLQILSFLPNFYVDMERQDFLFCLLSISVISS